MDNNKNRDSDISFRVHDQGCIVHPLNNTSDTRMRRFVFPLISLLILGAALGVFYVVSQARQEIRQQASVTGATLAINPARISKKQGDVFPIGITLQTGTDTVTAASISATIDEHHLEIVSLQMGSALPVILDAATAKSGRVSFVVGSDPSTPFNGTGILATITLRAVTPGTTSMIYDENTEIAAIGKPSNALTEITGSQITITSQNLLSPTPTPASGDLLFYIEDDQCKASTAPPIRIETYTSLGGCVGALNNLHTTPTDTATPSATPMQSLTPTPTTAPNQYTADYTGDGKVGIVDFVLFMNYWWMVDLEKADLNNDGKINAIDYTIVLNEWYDSLQNP